MSPGFLNMAQMDSEILKYLQKEWGSHLVGKNFGHALSAPKLMQKSAQFVKGRTKRRCWMKIR